MENETIQSMISNIAQGNTAEAQQQFVDMISNKLADQLDTLKQELAGSLYGESVDEAVEDKKGGYLRAPIKKSDWFNPTDSRDEKTQKAAYLNHLAYKRQQKLGTETKNEEAEDKETVFYNHKPSGISISRSASDNEGSLIHVHQNGKHLSTGYYDSDAGAFFFKVPGKAGDQHFNSAKELANHFGAKDESVDVDGDQLDEGRGLSNMTNAELDAEHKKIQDKINNAPASKRISMNHPWAQRARAIRLQKKVNSYLAKKNNESTEEVSETNVEEAMRIMAQTSMTDGQKWMPKGIPGADAHRKETADLARQARSSDVRRQNLQKGRSVTLATEPGYKGRETPSKSIMRYDTKDVQSEGAIPAVKDVVHVKHPTSGRTLVVTRQSLDSYKKQGYKQIPTPKPAKD